VKTLQKSTNVTSGLKILVAKIPNGSSWMAVEIQKLNDLDDVAKVLKAFLSNELKSVTVVLVKGL
jgi:hypothetical protein